MDAHEAHHIWSYNSQTGEFFWRVSPRYKISIGDAAGYFDGKYNRLVFKGKQYKASRVAWLMVMGEWPSMQIDHINGNKSDDSFSNLRLATNQQNTFNRVARKDNKLGVKGVYFNKKQKKYVAQCYVNGSNSRSSFATITEAKDAYNATARNLHGSFAKT